MTLLSVTGVQGSTYMRTYHPCFLKLQILAMWWYRQTEVNDMAELEEGSGDCLTPPSYNALSIHFDCGVSSQLSTVTVSHRLLSCICLMSCRK